jgi:hypothetical protein
VVKSRNVEYRGEQKRCWRCEGPTVFEEVKKGQVSQKSMFLSADYAGNQL